MKRTGIEYTLAEINGMIDHMDKLLLDVEQLTVQLKEAEELNTRLMFQNVAYMIRLEGMALTTLVPGSTVH